MKKLFFVATLGISAVCAPVAAHAATIVYTITGDYSGTRGGKDFSGLATLVGTGDTADSFNPDSSVTAVTLSSLTFTVNSVSSLIGGSNVFFVNRFAGTAGFALSDGGSFRTLLLSNAFLTYDGLSSFSSTTAEAVALPYSFATDAGQVTVNAASNVRIAAAAAAAVPEPASWALMILGFGAVGYAMRRKTVLRYV